jgi:hypothetical protein
MRKSAFLAAVTAILLAAPASAASIVEHFSVPELRNQETNGSSFSSVPGV